MKKLMQSLCAASLACALVGFVGCSKKEAGPMEKAGKAIDKAAEDTGKAMKDGAEKTEKATKDAAKKVEDAAN